MVEEIKVLRLKIIAKLYGMSARYIAEGSGTGYHRNSICNIWSNSSNPPPIRKNKIIDFLILQEVPKNLAEKAFDVVSEEQETVRLRKQLFDEEIRENPDHKLLTLGVIMLHKAIRQHFGLITNPFNVQQNDRPFESKAFQMCREMIELALEERGFLAISGVTGCGKSVLWTSLRMRFAQNENIRVAAVRRYDKGHIRIGDIYRSLLRDLVAEQPRGGNEITHSRVEELLVQHARASANVCLMVNEAHDLNWDALVMIKRLWEGFNEVPELSFSRACTVILLGQKGLEDMLKQKRPEMIEVSQRAALQKYGELEPDEIEPYLRHRFIREGDGTFEQVFDKSAVEFMAERNVPLTPLFINGIATNAMKKAFQFNDKQVTAEHIQRLL